MVKAMGPGIHVQLEWRNLHIFTAGSS